MGRIKNEPLHREDACEIDDGIILCANRRLVKTKEGREFRGYI